MNSYQKAAVLAVRIVAAYFIATSFLAFGVELLDRAMSNRPNDCPFYFYGNSAAARRQRDPRGFWTLALALCEAAGVLAWKGPRLRGMQPMRLRFTIHSITHKFNPQFKAQVDICEPR